MKLLINILTILAIILLSSCSKDDKEPEIIPLPIDRQFKTEIAPLRLSELKDFSEFKDRLYIINSIDDIPEDHYFSTEEFRKADIDFAEYSLIVTYQLFIGEIATYKYSWSYNNWNERYQFNITADRIKDSELVNGEVENLTYMRSAFLVKRIPYDSKWVISQNIHER